MPAGVRVVSVESAEQLRRAVHESAEGADAVSWQRRSADRPPLPPAS